MKMKEVQAFLKFLQLLNPRNWKIRPSALLSGERLSFENSMILSSSDTSDSVFQDQRF
jgi:hypothetical protein